MSIVVNSGNVFQRKPPQFIQKDPRLLDLTPKAQYLISLTLTVKMHHLTLSTFTNHLFVHPSCLLATAALTMPLGQKISCSQGKNLVEFPIVHWDSKSQLYNHRSCSSKVVLLHIVPTNMSKEDNPFLWMRTSNFVCWSLVQCLRCSIPTHYVFLQSNNMITTFFIYFLRIWSIGGLNLQCHS